MEENNIFMRRQQMLEKALQEHRLLRERNGFTRNNSGIIMNESNNINQNAGDCCINIKDFKNHYLNIKKYFENKETYALCNEFGKVYYVDNDKLYEYDIFSLDTEDTDINISEIKENYDSIKKNIIKPYDEYIYQGKYLFLIEEEKQHIFIRYRKRENNDYIIKYLKEYYDKSDRIYIELEELEKDKEKDKEKDNLAEFFKDDAPIYIVDKPKKPIGIKYSDETRKVLCVNDVEKPTKICVKYNTYQLENYIQGIENIEDNTEKEKNKNKDFTIFEIYKLIRDSNMCGNAVSYLPDNIEWEILTDENRVGCDEQRKFVEKALKTEDICVLKGPPGSGKTTCISELILQILHYKPRARILLMASTHVAVDNVLERLVDYNLPAVRLGVENRIADNMKEYIYPKVGDTEYEKFMEHHKNKDKDIEKYFSSESGEGEFKRLISDTTNIVCCTTNGIHKYIKDSDPIVTTNFDYLILDEASKTTIAEFLAVARYAKKWILIGDIKQLSPYTDADELSVSIKKDILYDIGISICKKDEYKNDNKKQKLIEEKVYPIVSKALLFNIKDFDKENLIYIFVPDDLDKELCIKLCNYIAKNINSKILVYYEFNNYNEKDKAILENFADIIISTKGFYKKNRKYFYKDPYNKEKYRIWDKEFKCYKGKEEEKDIAYEISWRLIRDYELRQLKENKSLKNKYVEKYIEEAEKLIPKELEKKIMARKDVVTQSILELTQKTLQEIEDKFQSIRFQHRMPDNLAELPRKIIYDGIHMLSDSENKYEGKTKWYDIVSKNADKENKDECKCIIDDIKKIVNRKSGEKVSIAILTFYKAQERLIQKELKKEYGKKNYIEIEKDKVSIRIATVDRFQGQEVDIVMISLSRNKGSGFLNSPNRINVAITRAKKERYIYGNHNFFLNNDGLEIMQEVAKWYKDNKLLEIRLEKKGSN